MPAPYDVPEIVLVVFTDREPPDNINVAFPGHPRRVVRRLEANFTPDLYEGVASFHCRNEAGRLVFGEDGDLITDQASGPLVVRAMTTAEFEAEYRAVASAPPAE